MTGRVLVVGHVCIDIINYLHRFPEEDTDVGSSSAQEALGGGGNRCLDQQWQRGGNASNTATVLSLLGADAEFLGSIPKGSLCRFIEDGFGADSVAISHCPRFEAQTPTSCVIVSQETGTRTIIHSNRDLPEVPAELVRSLPLAEYDWIHFEGRNINNVKLMIEYIRAERDMMKHKLTISVELEKPGRKELEVLLSLGDVIFVSKDYAKANGFSDMETTVRDLKKRTPPGSVLICPWGEVGAAACLPDGSVVSCDAHSPPSVVDTLGAGDTFIAAAIWRLRRGDDVLSAVRAACRVAGVKVGVRGFQCLRQQLESAGQLLN
ncbi:ketohexokinase-like isoform X2 [Pollicipes pollicipes]|nr:ketohexokinase-like isoform X2 [Pollicipes pollicipes]XP_037089385.1 ketohexokinase-like isoform X2 [Pollicipes pollicipes]